MINTKYSWYNAVNNCMVQAWKKEEGGGKGKKEQK